MSNEHVTTQQAAKRLLQALENDSTLSCEEAQAQLPALVEAEFAGEDVDQQPAFAALLRHLDQCADCMALYAELSEAMEALIGENDVLPNETPEMPRFFAPQRASEGVILRVLSALKRRFELTLTPPQLVPALPTLGTVTRVNLFSDTLHEVAGAPLVAATLNVQANGGELIVAIRDAEKKRWQVDVEAGETHHTVTTDEQGIARFEKLPITSLQSLTLQCTELDD